MRSVRLTVAVAAVAIGVLAGCSSESTTTNPGAVTSAAESSTAAESAGKPLADYLLKAGDVPAGFSKMNIPTDQLGAATDSLMASTKNAKVSPASCQPDLSAVSTESVTKNAAAYYANATTGDLIGSVVVPDTGYADKFRTYNLGQCATHQVTSSLNGQTFTGKVTSSTVDVDVPGVDGAVVIKQDVATEVPGTGPVTQSSLIALLPATGATVSITQKKLSGASAPDLATFTTVLAAAAKRVTG